MGHCHFLKSTCDIGDPPSRAPLLAWPGVLTCREAAPHLDAHHPELVEDGGLLEADLQGLHRLHVLKDQGLGVSQVLVLHVITELLLQIGKSCSIHEHTRHVLPIQGRIQGVCLGGSGPPNRTPKVHKMEKRCPCARECNAF